MKIPINFIIQIVPAVIFVLFCFFPAWIILKIYDYKIKIKKSPLNIDLLRSPGESIQSKIDDTSSDILLKLLMLPIIPVFLYTTAITQYSTSQNKLSDFIILIYATSAILCTAYFCYAIYKLLRKRNLLRLGLECEVAVGQDLQNLIPYKFKIYNDFQAGKFNIDHIAIGPTGVFAIETKGRAKFVNQEKDNWKLEFDGKKLQFPSWVETKPIEQAIIQAKWLQNWIQKSTAEQVYVTPVLAFPGWYITRKAKSDIHVYNGKRSEFLAKGKTVLTEAQIQTISFQIEKVCRDITAKSYKNG